MKCIPGKRVELNAGIEIFDETNKNVHTYYLSPYKEFLVPGGSFLEGSKDERFIPLKILDFPISLVYFFKGMTHQRPWSPNIALWLLLMSTRRSSGEFPRG